MVTSDVDGFEREYIFCMWPGEDKLTPDRATEVFSILSNSQRPVIFLTPRSFKLWELPSAPFHPATQYISECHMSDYLRVYLMHHFGGGYTDVKFTFKSWVGAFATLKNNPEALVLGYPFSCAEDFGLSKKFDGTTILADFHNNYFPFGIGHTAFIFKPKSILTEDMLNMLHEFLDEKLPELKENPSKTQKDYLNRVLPDGSISKYPLDYIEMGPDIFHMALYKHKNQIMHHDIQPATIYHFDLPIEGFAEKKRQFAEAHLPIWPFISKQPITTDDK